MTMDNSIHSLQLIKYPRTDHLEGSRPHQEDSEDGLIPYRQLVRYYIVVEEKSDGANCTISFSAKGELLLQSRGHYLLGGGREKQFNLLKQWSVAYEDWLFDRLTDRYVMSGEWLHKKTCYFL